MKDKLDKLGLSLPEPSKPGGNYTSVNVRGRIAYVAIQFPIHNGAFHYLGRLGANLSTEEGYKAMEMAALNVLAQIDAKVGFDKVEGLNHIDTYYQVAEDWDDMPKVANGASDLFVNILENKGQHSRALFGVQKLPRDFCVGLTASFTLKETK